MLSLGAASQLLFSGVKSRNSFAEMFESFQTLTQHHSSAELCGAAELKALLQTKSRSLVTFPYVRSSGRWSSSSWRCSRAARVLTAGVRGTAPTELPEFLYCSAAVQREVPVTRCRENEHMHGHDNFNTSEILNKMESYSKNVSHKIQNSYIYFLP